MRVGLGLMRISNMSVEEVHELLVNASNAGIDFLDLADIYGNRHCEELVGEVFRLDPELRNKFYVQTKIGINKWECGYDNSSDYIISSTIDCINRLNIRTLDCLLIHRPDIFMDNKEIKQAIKILKRYHLIKDFGVSNFSASEIAYLKQSHLKIKYNQVQIGLGNTTMIDQTMYTNIPENIVSKQSDDLFFYLKKEHITIQAWSPFIYGFFEGSIFDKNKYPKLYEVLEKYAKIYNTSICAIASAWVLSLTKDLILLTGSTNISHIKEAIDGLNIKLTKADWYRIYKETDHLLP